ncbi:MAG: endonuclease/exonuclease/phosphatase family protein [Treponemataceae bacterium]|nr:endonuclease/exonuclease/phosphatase family protein [Treponemataceae bacterium]
MRRFFAALAVLALAAAACAERLTLLSFNMGGRNRTAAAVAAMIAESGADIAFLQEIWVSAPNNAALKAMAAQLGDGRWDFATSSAYILSEPRSAGGETYKAGANGQNNAILYDTAKVTLHDLADEAGFTRFDGDFLFDKNAVQLVRFSLRGGARAQFVAINVHLPYTDKAHRRRDLRTLERLYARYKRAGGIVVAGDFNTPRSELTARNFDFVDGTERWFSDRHVGIATTLSTKGDNQIRFANDYDHFVYSTGITVAAQMSRAFSDSRGKTVPSLPFGTTVYTSSTAYRAAVSDHVPIIITLEF